ncbi:MAG: flagellar protein FlgN, partial [Peptococcaceae bacterium]|nr:flagellar protein FlgN [Peptococcaceae bacterium]
NLDSLKEVIGKEEALFKVFREQEEQRGRTAADLALCLGLPKNTVLPVFINDAPKHLAGPLTELLAGLTNSLEELAETNRLNNLLTRQALGVNEMIFKIINSTGEKVYNTKGVIEKGHRISILDKKA